MKQSELSYCANRAAVMEGMIRRANGATDSQQPEIVLQAIDVAEDIADRLRAQLPFAARVHATQHQPGPKDARPTPPAPKDTRDGRVPKRR